jgi:sulfur-carrier protein
MEVKVLFFGVLAEVTGTDCRLYRDVKSVDNLIHIIMDEFPEIQHYNYRISLNNLIIEGDQSLNDKDEVALMPPFAGG